MLEAPETAWGDILMGERERDEQKTTLCIMWHHKTISNIMKVAHALTSLQLIELLLMNPNYKWDTLASPALHT